jgi:hypothetical protein
MAAMDDPRQDQAHDPTWFRQPTRREHVIAGALFLGFAAFFMLLAGLWHGKWFMWVLAGLSIWSALYAIGHLRDARKHKE